MALADLFPSITLAEIKEVVAQYAATALLDLTAWQSGSPGEQLYQAFAQGLQYYTTGNSTVIRGFFLDLATDPGDYDPYNSGNEALTPAAGFLSALGENVFFTTRPGATFATTPVTFTNSSSTPQTFSPGSVTVARVGYPEITYTNTADPAFYTEAGGTRTLASGEVLDIEFSAQEAGTAFNAPAGELTVLVSGWPSVTVTNAAAALGTDRMSADDYRALCRTQAAATSPNGANDAYQRAATTALDGTALLQSTTVGGDGITPVGITRTYVSGSSATGAVDVYYADSDGPSIAVDVLTANENIGLNVISVPGTITFTGLAATAVPIVVTWAVKYKAVYLGQAITGATVKASINAALTARFATYPIGGFDQVLGAGTIEIEEIRGTVKGAHAAIYSASLSSPAGDTAIALGGVAVLTTPTGTETAG